MSAKPTPSLATIPGAARDFVNGLGPGLTSIAVFCLVLSTHFASPVTTITDSIWTLHIATSVVRVGNQDLDEYRDRLSARGNYFTFEASGAPDRHTYSYFPYGTALLVVPPVFVADRVLLGRGYDLYKHLQTDDPGLGDIGRLELALASGIIAMAATVCYLTGRLYLSNARSLLFACIFAFGTSAWSTASRALWQHGPSVLMLFVALYLVLRGARQSTLIQFAGIPLALSYVIRPTNSIAILLITAYVANRSRRQLPGYLLGLFVVMGLFVALNVQMYGQFLPPYYAAGRLAYHPQFWEALAANLISPARGLFVFSPILLVVPVSIVGNLVRRQPLQAFDVVALAAVAGHWLAISAFPENWTAGYSFGPRLLTDVLPFTMYLLLRPLQQLSWRIDGRLAPAAAVFIGLLAISVFINYRGATAKATWEWNGPIPNVVASVDDDRSRIWDWRDPQFTRGLTERR